MASLRGLLRKYVTLDHLHAVLAGDKAVPIASAEAAGLMSAEMARKLSRVEDNATGDMNPNEVVGALEVICKAGGLLPLNVGKVGGKAVGDLALREHKHDDRYVPRDQIADMHSQFLQLVRDAVSSANTDIESVACAVSGLAAEMQKLLEPARVASALALLKETGINAGKVGGLTVEDLDKRFERVGARPAQPQNTAPNGGLVKGGRFSPDVAKCKLWRYANGGDHAFVPPATKDDYEVKVAVLHTKDAGRIDFEGFGGNRPPLFGEHYKHGAHLLVVTKIGPFFDLDVRLLKEPELHG
jgi:hypothetical protein